MKYLFTVLITVIAVQVATGQPDTVYHYFSKYHTEATIDSAFTTLKLYKQNDLWHGIEYFKNGLIKSEGNFTDSNAKEPVGKFTIYKDDGELFNIIEWKNGKVAEANYFYKNGNKRSRIIYAKKGRGEHIGWDENGIEIKNFIVEKEARFKGGLEGWKKYLEKTLNAHVAADAGAPTGNHTVKVEFVVSKEAYVSNVIAVSIPGACKPCATEAVRVIAKGPNWEPAIQNNEPVIYQALQYITFQVDERRGRRRS